MTDEPRSAAEAFDALAARVSGQSAELPKLKAAIEKVGTNSELTLARMAQDVDRTREAIHDVVVRLPPAGLPGETEMSAAMQLACDRMQEVLGRVQKACGSAAERQVQRQWLVRTAGAGFLAGLVLCLAVAVIFPRMAGALMAARIVGESDWNAGQALMRRGDPESWDRMARLYNACPHDVAIEFCTAAMAVRTITPGGADQPATAGTARIPVGRRGSE